MEEILEKKKVDSISYMGVSKNNGTPKWMVYFMENHIKMDDLGVYTPIFGNTHMGFIDAK